MTRKIDLRNNCNSKIRSISNNIFYLLLSIESTISHVIKFIPVRTDHSAVSPGSDFRQFRIFLDFNPPALVITEMPMKSIQFICRHYIKIPLDLIYTEEMPGNIQMHTSICKSRFILDGNARKHPLHARTFLLAEISGRKKLPDGLHCISETGN